MRRKRRGDYPVWDATIQAAISTGAVITAGDSELKPLVFTLPENDGTFHTRDFHPLQRELFDKATVKVDDEEDYDEDDLEVPTKSRGRPSLRYKRDPFFNLAKKEKVFLKTKTKTSSSLGLTGSPIPLKKARAMADDGSDPTVPSTKQLGGEPEKATPTRKAPQKWTSDEKKIFVETLEKHGEILKLRMDRIAWRLRFTSNQFGPYFRAQLASFSSSRWHQDNQSDQKLLLRLQETGRKVSWGEKEQTGKQGKQGRNGRRWRPVSPAFIKGSKSFRQQRWEHTF